VIALADCKFDAESVSERMFKIGQYLAKILTKVCDTFLWLTVCLLNVDRNDSLLYWSTVLIVMTLGDFTF